MAQATFDQYLEIGQMMRGGTLDRETAQAIVEQRFTVKKISVPAEDSNAMRVRLEIDPQVPCFPELQQRFPGGCCEKLHGPIHGFNPFRTHSSCANAGSRPGNRVFHLWKLKKTYWDTEDLIAEALQNGDRPATLGEALCFHVQTYNTTPFAILGYFFFDDDGNRRILQIKQSALGACLLDRDERGWIHDQVVLLVRR